MRSPGKTQFFGLGGRFERRSDHRFAHHADRIERHLRAGQFSSMMRASRS
jgi:hypothetical protein